MFNRNLLFLLGAWALIQGVNCMVASKKAKDCEKQARQLNNRVKSAAKDFKYISNSFTCNVQYIFDKAYSGFYSDVDELKQVFKKNSGGSVFEKCKKDHDFSVISQQPYDFCYKNNELAEIYANFNKWEKGSNEICQNCNSKNEEDCVAGVRELSDELEQFKGLANSFVKDIEKNIDDCVTKTAEKVNAILEDLKEKFNSCMNSS